MYTPRPRPRPTPKPDCIRVTTSSSRRIRDRFLQGQGYTWDEDRETLHCQGQETNVTLQEAMHALASQGHLFAKAWLEEPQNRVEE